MKSLHALLAVSALALAGCAAGPDVAQQNDGFDDLQTRTGSNMLVRTNRAKQPKDSTAAQELLEEMRANAAKPEVNLDK